jgi:1-acyl-sn-glycerol-3-phosphate acyltransferase
VLEIPRIVLKTLEVSIETIADSLARRLTVARTDRRLNEWSRKLVEVAGVRIVAEQPSGVDAIDWSKPLVVMSNHQSHLDIPVLYQVVGGTLRMVGKKELFRVPIWGRAMREGGMVCIDRGDRQKAIASLREASQSLQRGVNIWIAPEGTRSKDGQLGPLKKGGFVLAREVGASIVPVRIDGTREALPVGSSRIRKGKTVHVRVGKPIAVEGRATEEVMAAVQAMLERPAV